MSLHQRQQLQQQLEKPSTDSYPISPRIMAAYGFPQRTFLSRTNFLIILAFVFVVGFTSLHWSSQLGSLSSIFSSSKLEGRFDLSLAQWKDYTLDQAAAFVAKNGSLIICAVSQAYLPFLNNWLISVTRQKRQEQVLVIAEDYFSLYEVNSRWPGHAVLVPPALAPQAAHKFGSQGFFNFTSRRPRHLLHILELGYSVMYNDVDMVWLADPFPYLEGNRDVYFVDDMTAVKPLNHAHDLPPPGKKGRTYICSCMIFLNPMPGAKLLMRTWIEVLKEQPWSQKVKSNDQPAFNWALNRTAGQVDVYLLDQAAFPTGGLYFKNKTWVKETKGMHVIIHNNYIIGFEKKTKRFKDYNLWLVDDHSDESPLGKIEANYR